MNGAAGENVQWDYCELEDYDQEHARAGKQGGSRIGL